METTDVVLRVPAARVGCAQWLQDQPPDAVADVLGTCKMVHDTMLLRARHGDAATVDEARALQQEVSRAEHRIVELREEHARKLTACRAEACGELDLALEEQKTLLARKYQHTIHELEHSINQQNEELQRLRGNEAVFRQQLVDDYERKLGEKVLQRDEMHAKEVELLHSSMDSMDALRRERDEYIRTMHAEHESKYAVQYQHMEKLVRSLTGTTTAVGRMGERFVDSIHSKMELGMYIDDSHNRQVGYADGTWEYDTEAGKIVCLCEVKYGFPDQTETQLHGIKDIEKFQHDVRAAVDQGRVNAAIMFSLEKRISGKPHLAIEVKLGVPTIWASRDADDVLPASLLVQLAFRTMVQIWPCLLHTQGGESLTLLPAMAANINQQLEVYARMDKQINGYVDQANRMIRSANDMRKQLNLLIGAAHSLKLQHPALVTDDMMRSADFWETDDATTLMRALREYRTEKGRHAQHVDQLGLTEGVVDRVRASPDIFVKAIHRIKAEIQCTSRSVQKRKHADAEI